MRPSSPGLVAAFAEGATAQGVDVVDDRPRLDRPALLRQRQPRPARRDVHRQPQPRAVQRHQAVPRRRRARSARTPAWPRSATSPSSGARRPPTAARATVTQQDLLAGVRRATCAAWSTCRGIRPLKVVVDAGNGMAGHTVPDRPRRPAARRRPAVLRARRHLPQPRGQPARPGEPGRPAGRGSARTAPTSGWPSTATPTAASSSTSAASRCRRRRSPRWSRPASWPGTRRRRSSTT